MSKIVLILLGQHYTTEKPMQCFPQEAPDNFVYEKTLCNVVLIFLGQHCAGQNPMQYYPRGSR